MSDFHVADQQAAINAAKEAEKLSDEQLRDAILKTLQQYGYSQFPPDMDTSREGLLDFIAGAAAIAHSYPPPKP